MGNLFLSPERKTSLGREWHPTCLKCNECGRVLAPGQHAEHKGLPYCHHPCYRALFGPDIIGFGSTVSQPKGRPNSCSLDYYDIQEHQQQQQPSKSSKRSASSSSSNFTCYINNDDLHHDHHHQQLQQNSFTSATRGTNSSSTSGSATSTNATPTFYFPYNEATLKVRGFEPLLEETNTIDDYIPSTTNGDNNGSNDNDDDTSVFLSDEHSRTLTDALPGQTTGIPDGGDNNDVGCDDVNGSHEDTRTSIP